ncbi:hypothetical protein IFM89_024115 [Coptis chinensis]|uniref:glycerophosphodiester phosphodiesterase n=1 Tax=Coptis chinensis TaxID=261450 RepID=A0A835LX12_9MAGN|nr:hypothetical protein IFM89_024115 [Coptis chinensis]
MASFRVFLLVSVVVEFLVLVSAQRSNRTASLWKTLNGAAPLVIARGGFSGLFPDSSSNAYELVSLTSLPNTILWCDVQLTKDGVGICLSALTFDESTTFNTSDTKKVYNVNGVPTTGWFTVDYDLNALQQTYLLRTVPSRTQRFDGLFPILTVEEVPPGLWLNIQHDAFFTQHNLSMRSYVLSVSRRVIVSYVSSPEVGFLKSIVTRFNGTRTKLIFCFLEADKTEPSTNQTYGALLKNLTFVKTFSSGILVPKKYIWPVDVGQYLLPHTSLVSDAHREGLEVFASDFANDFTFSYNYSFDPIAEYLSFVDNGDFSVDGVLSDFPITPSEAIAAPKIISHHGASGVYPDCTDLAYNQAVEDGADYIDCSVQMTSDGIPICLSSINLIDTTTVTQSPFGNLAVTVPEIQANPGIFTFNLTWKDIQTLKRYSQMVFWICLTGIWVRNYPAAISHPYSQQGYQLSRNPAYKNAGRFLSLVDFLNFAKIKRLAGILISIENAAYLAEEKGMSVINSVVNALSISGYNNHTTQEIVIQSTNKSVLAGFKKQTEYKLMYMVDEDIRSADNSSIQDIKSFADYVAITKKSVFPENLAFITGLTNIVPKLQSVNLTVYVYTFMNEFVEQAWDFFSDPVVEINNFVMQAGIDGVITDFPGTAAAYRNVFFSFLPSKTTYIKERKEVSKHERLVMWYSSLGYAGNKCLNMGANTPAYMSPVEPGGLLKLLKGTPSLPPAQAPNPVLTENDVTEAPLPPVSNQVPTTGGGGSAEAPSTPTPSSHARLAACISLSSFSLLLASLLVL